jgi:hypothetical protein
MLPESQIDPVVPVPYLQSGRKAAQAATSQATGKCVDRLEQRSYDFRSELFLPRLDRPSRHFLDRDSNDT